MDEEGQLLDIGLVEAGSGFKGSGLNTSARTYESKSDVFVHESVAGLSRHGTDNKAPYKDASVKTSLALLQSYEQSTQSPKSKASGLPNLSATRLQAHTPTMQIKCCIWSAGAKKRARDLDGGDFGWSEIALN